MKAEVTAGVANGFARLVFTLPDDAEANVRLNNGIVVIAFKQPVNINVDHLALAMPGYVAAARRDPDGAAVRLALTRKVTVNSMAAGERLYVDLLPTGWSGMPPGLPQEVVEELARRAREAEKKVRRQQPQQERKLASVRVRIATLPNRTRYTFPLPESIAVAADHGKDRLTLTFDKPLHLDLADAKAALPAGIVAVDAEVGDDGATVSFGLSGKVDVKTFREEGAFVVDVMTGPRDRSSSLPSPDKAAEKPEPKASPTEPPAAPVPAPVAASSAASAATVPAASKETHAGAEPAASASAEPKSQQERAEKQATSLPAANDGEQPQPATVSDANAKVAAIARQHGTTVQLVFPFRTPTSAAVFRRGETVWLVFDSGAPIDLSGLKENTGRLLRDVSVRRSSDGQVVRIRMERPRASTLTADSDAWLVTLGDTILDPTAPLAITRTINASAHASATIPLEMPRQVHRLADPDLGDKLMVVTAHAPARGFLKPHDLVDFRVLPSTHGVVIEPLADDLSAELAPEHIVVSRAGGLTLTPPAGALPVANGMVARPAVLEAQSWAADRQADFLERRTALLNAAAEAPEPQRNAARADLARFYLARGMFSDAKGVLDVTLAAERTPDEVAKTLVLRGIANLMLHREQEALKDFGNPVIGNQHDAQLWRALALSRQGRFTEAREGFRDVETASAGLPMELQRFTLKEALRCAIETGDFSQAARQLHDFEALGIPAEIKPSLAVLQGRVAEGLGHLGDALTAYRAAAQSSDEPAAAQGRLRQIALRHTLKQIERAETIAELEMLTAGWRGDETEVEALRLLTRLYSEDGRYRDAFHAMRVALSAHPRSELTRRIQDESAITFDQIFLGDRGEGLTPVEALGLFYDFRTLTPPGRRGDEMIRRLAERLVGMDLLEQASELLQHQIDHRLQGAARPQVAARLAIIYLMNRKPDRALQALRATRMADLPNEIRQQRLLIEARALSETGRHDLALEIIEEMRGREVQRLRADILWTARRWRDGAEEIERLYAERWREAAPLDGAERMDVLRAAVGYALADDIIGLDRFRQKYTAKMAEGVDHRMFEVVTAPLSARAEEFRDIAKAASSVDTLGTFLKDLRTRFPDAPGTAAAGPQPGQG